MQKYKTLSNSYRQSLEQSLEKRLFDPVLNRRTLDSSGESPLMSNNKSIIYIKLPKRNPLSTNLRNSLYQSTLKRMKQLKPNPQHSPIPDPPKRKRYEQFQEEVIRQYNLEKEQREGKGLPIVHTTSNKIQPYKSNYNIFLQQKSEEQQQPRKSRDLTLDRAFFFGEENSAFGYKNLKEKYLKSKQSSLNNRRRMQQWQKNQSSSQLQYYQQQQGYRNSTRRFKMNKAIEDHMNRYNQKDLFHARLKGFKTNIHPIDKSPKVKQGDEHSFESEFSNFVKRKKLKSMAMHPHDKSQLKNRLKVSLQSPQGAKISDCTPWETDHAHFQ